MDIQRLLNDPVTLIDVAANRLSTALAAYSQIGRDLKVIRTGAQGHRVFTVVVTSIEPLPVRDEEEFVALFFLHGFQATSGGRYETHRGRWCQEWVLSDGSVGAPGAGATAPWQGDAGGA